MSPKKSKKSKQLENTDTSPEPQFEDDVESFSHTNPSSNVIRLVNNNRSRIEETRHKLSIQEKRNTVSSYIETHRVLCEELSTIINNLNTVCNKMVSLDKKMSNPDMRDLFLSKKLNVSSSIINLKNAAMRLDRDRKLSVMFNNVRKEDILKDVEDVDQRNSHKPIFR